MFLQQLFLGFLVVGVRQNAINRTNVYALWFIKISNTLGAEISIDLVDIISHFNRLVLADGFAYIAVNAFFGNHKGHILSPFKLSEINLVIVTHLILMVTDSAGDDTGAAENLH
jgi:hypothetical protein